MDTRPFAIAALFALLSGCQTERVVDAPESATTTVSARVLRGATVPVALYSSTDSVNVRLQAGSYDSAKGALFTDHGCSFSKVPVGAAFNMTLRGFRDRKLIWSGNANGTTKASGTTGGSTAADVVVESSGAKADSLLQSLSIVQGSGFEPDFASSTRDYEDSVDEGVMSVDVQFRARTSSDVVGVKCNGASCSGVTLSGTDPANIDVVVANLNGYTFTYAIKVYHKTSVPVDDLDSTLVELCVNGTSVPDFSGGRTSYVLSLKRADAPKLFVNAIAKDVDAMVMCNSRPCTDSIAWDSGDTTTLKVKVTRANSHSLEYTIKVYKDTGDVVVAPCDSLLAALMIDGAGLPSFRSDSTPYVYDAAATSATIAVSGKARTSADSLAFECGTFDIATEAFHKTACASIPLLSGDTTYVVAYLVSKDSDTGGYGIKVYRPGNDYGIPWKTGIGYGSFRDSRDGHLYKTVDIGGMTWMAENLAYSNGGSVGICPSSSDDSCAKYGRHYTWIEAMQLGIYYQTGRYDATTDHRGVCPEGWHVPSDLEWGVLELALGMTVDAIDSIGWRGAEEGAKLKSKTGWGQNNGTDAYGFRALPAGFNGFENVGLQTTFWTSTEGVLDAEAGYRGLSGNTVQINRAAGLKANATAVRCVSDVLPTAP